MLSAEPVMPPSETSSLSTKSRPVGSTSRRTMRCAPSPSVAVTRKVTSSPMPTALPRVPSSEVLSSVLTTVLTMSVVTVAGSLSVVLTPSTGAEL